MKERGVKPLSVPAKTLDTPGKSTRRERERAEAAKQANQQKPRWDLVASIETMFKDLAVA